MCIMLELSQMNLDMKFLDNTGAPEEAEPSSWLAREILIIELNSLNQTVKHTGSRQKVGFKALHVVKVEGSF